MSKQRVKRPEPSFFDDRVVLHLRCSRSGRSLSTDATGTGLSRRALARAWDEGKAIEIDCARVDHNRQLRAADPAQLLRMIRKIARIGHGHDQERVVLTLTNLSEGFSTKMERVLAHQGPRQLSVADRDFVLSTETRTVYSQSITVAIDWERSTRKSLILDELSARDGAYCAWCATPLTSRHLQATVDHVKPRSQGGPDGLDNLLLACHDCNNARGDLPAAEWLRRCVVAGQTPIVPIVVAAIDRAGLTHGGLVLVKAA